MSQVRSVTFCMSELAAVVDDWCQDGFRDLPGRLRVLANVLEGKDGESGASVPSANFVARSVAGDARRVILEMANTGDRITSRVVAERCDCSQESARQVLQRLAALGVLRARGRQRGRHYLPCAKIAQVGTSENR